VWVPWWHRGVAICWVSLYVGGISGRGDIMSMVCLCLILCPLPALFMVIGQHQNPGYMKENFFIIIESYHIGDTGQQENVSWK